MNVVFKAKLVPLELFLFGAIVPLASTLCALLYRSLISEPKKI
ncbi:hypothetical protein [Acinetobacter junii]|nr:hypothetical protein [Acinetobacter junii]